MREKMKQVVFLAALGAAAMIALPGAVGAQERERPKAKGEASLPQLAANGVGLCVPCHPVLTVTGANPNSQVNLVVETWTSSGFEQTLVEGVGVTDVQGDLPSVKLPDDGFGIKAVSAEVGGRQSDRLLVEMVEFCGGPILCGPIPLRALVFGTLFRPGQPVPIGVNGAPAFAAMEVTVEQNLDGTWIPVPGGTRGEADCEGRLNVTLGKFEPGLYRALVQDLGTGATSNVVLYEVRDCQ